MGEKEEFGGENGVGCEKEFGKKNGMNGMNRKNRMDGMTMAREAPAAVMPERRARWCK